MLYVANFSSKIHELLPSFRCRRRLSEFYLSENFFFISVLASAENSHFSQQKKKISSRFDHIFLRWKFAEKYLHRVQRGSKREFSFVFLCVLLRFSHQHRGTSRENPF